MNQNLVIKTQKYLQKLCVDISERGVGSAGNIDATTFFEEVISALGWETELQEFQAIDWEEGGASITAENISRDVLVSPYSLGCDVEGELLGISTLSELQQCDIKYKVVLLYGDIAKEQIMPKNFVFYNPEEHQNIVVLLESGLPAAIITATGRNAALAGGVYPFPMFEDGDFDIPSVYTTEEEGLELVANVGRTVSLKSSSKRIPGKGFNVVARKGNTTAIERIVITAHIDAKKGTPGAIDNGTGVTILLLLAELLGSYNGDKSIEIVAFNGEDYYAVPGQMLYIDKNEGNFKDIKLNINIDGAGYIEGKTAISFYEVPEKIKSNIDEVQSRYSGVVEGVQWPQGDHSIFVQYGRPAIAVSSQWFTENIDTQEITHTKKDNLDIVDVGKTVEIAEFLAQVIKSL